MSVDRITITSVPPQSIEEQQGIKTTDTRIYPGLGSVAVTPSGSSTPPSTSRILYAVRILKPTLSAGAWSYTIEEEITHLLKEAKFTFHRLGGLGEFFAVFAGEAESRAATWAGSRYEIEVSVKLPDDSGLSVWYRGIIDAMNTRRYGQAATVQIEGGSYAAELRKVRVERTFAAGTTVRSMVETILDNDIVGNNSRIIKDTAKLIAGGSSYTTTDVVNFDHNAFDAIRLLAELQGDIEWGVDTERDFYFRAKSSSTSQNHMFVGQNLGDVERNTVNYYNFTDIDF